MSFIDRLLGRRSPAEPASEPLVVNREIENPLGLQVLFSEPRPLDAAGLTRDLRTFDRTTARGSCELDDALAREGKLLGLAGWGKHVVRFVGLAAPMPAGAVETCVAPAHYPEVLKQHARNHRAHALLYYAGYDPAPLEQYVALATMATVLGRLRGLVVLNEGAHASLPVSMLLDIAASDRSVEMLRALPLPYLYCGFVKHEVEDVTGVWMRTYGAARLALPDFAAHAQGHHEAQRYFDLFENVFRYVLDSGARLGRGHTVQIGRDYLRLRAPKLDESYLVPDGELLVIESIGPDEING